MCVGWVLGEADGTPRPCCMQAHTPWPEGVGWYGTCRRGDTQRPRGRTLRTWHSVKTTMALILWLQALEPHALWRSVFMGLSWCGDGPLYFLLFPLLYWRKAPAVAIRYGYVVGLAVLLLTVMKAQTTTSRPFLVAPDQVAFWPSSLAGFTWFPSRDALIDTYRRDPSFPSGHALCAAAVGLYLYAHTASVGGRVVLASFVVLIPLARLYLGVHYPTDVLAGSGLGVLVFLLATRLRIDALTTHLTRWGMTGWPGRVLLVGLLTLGLGVVAKAAAVLWVVFLSYPLIVRRLAPRIASLAQWHDEAWRRVNAVVGCLGVGGMLVAAAPLRHGGSSACQLPRYGPRSAVRCS
jgi:membrane-associated phospholipid phosphatase